MKGCDLPVSTKQSNLCRPHNKVPRLLLARDVKETRTPLRAFVEGGRSIEWFLVHPFVGNDSSRVEVSIFREDDLRKHLTISLCEIFAENAPRRNGETFAENAPQRNSEEHLRSLLYSSEACCEKTDTDIREKKNAFFAEVVFYFTNFPEFAEYAMRKKNPYYEMYVDAIVEINLKEDAKKFKVVFHSALEKATTHTAGLFCSYNP